MRRSPFTEEELRGFYEQWINGSSLTSIASQVWTGKYKNIVSCEASLSGTFKRRGWKTKGQQRADKPATHKFIFSVPQVQREKVTKLTPELRARIKAAIDKESRIRVNKFGRIERQLELAHLPLRNMKLPDDVVIAAHRKYVDEALSMNKLGEVFLDRFQSAESAGAALRQRFCELGLPVRTQSETWAAKRRLTDRQPA